MNIAEMSKILNDMSIYNNFDGKTIKFVYRLKGFFIEKESKFTCKVFKVDDNLSLSHINKEDYSPEDFDLDGSMKKEDGYTYYCQELIFKDEDFESYIINFINNVHNMFENQSESNSSSLKSDDTDEDYLDGI